MSETHVSTEVGHHVHGWLPRSVIMSRWLCMTHRVHLRVHKIVSPWGDDVSIEGHLS